MLTRVLKYLSICNIVYCSILIAQTSRDEVVQILYPADGEVINNDTVDVIFNVADFFQLGGEASDDGYIVVSLDGTDVTTVTSGVTFALTGLLDGEYFLKLEAVDPSGESFSPEASDTVTFSINWQEDFCPPAGLEVSSTTSYGSLVLNWEEPSGGGSFSEDFTETFDTELPDDWTVINSGTAPDYSWNWTQPTGTQSIDGTSYMRVDSDAAGSANDFLDEELITPVLNTQGSSELYLVFDHYYWHLGFSQADVDVWDGDDWVTVASFTVTSGTWSVPDQQVLDLSDYANSELQVRFHYIDGGSWAWYWALDNVVISATAPGERSVYTYTLTEFGWDMNTLSKEKLVEKYPANEGPYSIVDESTIVEHIVNSRDEIPTCGNLQGYDVYKDGSVIAAGVDTNYYFDENVTMGTTYCYTVKAIYLSEAGSTVYSDTSNQACGVPESYNPPPPTYLSAIEGDEEVTLSWAAPGLVFTEGDVIQNPFFIDAIPFNAVGSTVGFNDDYDEACPYTGSTSPDVVYSFTPSSSMTVDISLCDSLSAYDTKVYVYDAGLNAIDCNDDACANPTQTFLSLITGLELVGGNTYFVVVDGYGGGSGNYELWVEESTGRINYQPSTGTKDTGRDLTGSEITPLDDYIAGINQTLDFNFHIASPDAEYADGFILTFPEGWVITGGTIMEMEASDVSGNIITFGDPYAASGFGPFFPGDYPFEVTLSAPADGGDVTVDYFIGGDGYGDEPHSIEGSFILDENIFEAGDLMGYNVYVDGILDNTGIIGLTNYTVYGLTNNTTYAMGVTAVYFMGENETSESEAITITATPTYLFGDITGVVTDPNGAALDSVIVSSGDVSDTTGTDGAYTLWNLTTGVKAVTARRSGFYTSTLDVDVLAQAESTVQDFVLSPDMPRPVGLSAVAGDELVHLSWNTPGGMELYELFYDDGVHESSITGGTDQIELAVFFNPNVSGEVVQGRIMFTDIDGWGYTSDPVEIRVYTTSQTEPPVLVYTGEELMEVSELDVWLDYEFPAPIPVDEEGFLLGFRFTTGAGPGIARDETGYVLDHSYVNFGDNVWQETGYIGFPGNFMIRAVAALDGEPEGTQERHLTVLSGGNQISAIIDHENTGGFEYSEENITVQPRVLAGNRTREDVLDEYKVYGLDSLENETLVATTTDTFTTIAVSSNYQEYCYHVRAVWTTEDYGVLESRTSNQACTIPYTLGDADFDSDADITDVLAVVDFILEEVIPSDDQVRNVDVNMDEAINIADVVMIVDIILGGTARHAGFDADEIAYVDLLTDYDNSQLKLDIEYSGPVRGLQFELSYDPEMVILEAPSLMEIQENVILSYVVKEPGILKVIAADIDGGAIERSENTILNIPMEFRGQARDVSQVSMDEIALAGANGDLVNYVARTSHSEVNMIPASFALHQNYPNPFNPKTEIRFDLPEEGMVELAIYNLMGQKIRTLTSNHMTPGYHAIVWDGTNDIGSQVATGMYFYSLSSRAFHSTKKMLYLK